MNECSKIELLEPDLKSTILSIYQFKSKIFTCEKNYHPVKLRLLKGNYYESCILLQVPLQRSLFEVMLPL